MFYLAESAAGRPASSMFVMIIIMVFAMYFLVLKPQKKQNEKRMEMMDALKVGDKVVTIGGILGTLVELDDELIKLEVADGVVITMLRNAIRGPQLEPDEDEAEEEENKLVADTLYNEPEDVPAEAAKAEEVEDDKWYEEDEEETK